MKFLLLFLLLVIYTSIIFPQWSTDPSINNLIADDDGHSNIQMVKDGNGGAIIAWQRYSGDVYMQKISSGAVTTWPAPPGLFVDTVSEFYGGYNMVSDDHGGVIFVMWNAPGWNGPFDIFVQRIDGNGVKQWPVIGGDGIHIAAPGFMFSPPNLLSDGSGGTFLVWENGGNLFAQKISAGGSVEWADGGVDINVQDADLGYPSLYTDDAGGAFILWEKSSCSCETDLYAQRVNSDGLRLWDTSGVPVVAADLGQTYEDAVSDGNGNLIVTWSDARNDPDFWTLDVYAQKINADGTPAWAINGIPIAAYPDDQGYSVLTADGSGGAIIAWEDSRSSDTGCDIYAQRVDANGNGLWTPGGIRVNVETDDQAYLDILSTVDGGAIVAWEIWGSDVNISAQKINADSTLAWAPAGAPVSTVLGTQMGITLADDENGGAYVVWQDYRNNITEVYASHLFSIGFLPVELNSFTARMINNNTLLKWTTKTEVNNYGFEIQRSSSLQTGATPHQENWEKIGFVKGNGSSNSPMDYTYNDLISEKTDKLFYRLKQIDNDGKYSYSDEVEVSFTPAKFNISQNYPNPFNPETKINYEIPEESNVSIKLYDVLGNELKTLVSKKQEPGYYSADLNGSDLAAGVYIYRIRADKYEKTMKMMLLK